MVADLQFALLGPVTARRGPLAIAIGPPQRRALLALLLLARSQAVPVAVIRERLWPAGAPTTAVNAIQGHVHHLRRHLRQHAPADAPAPPLTSHPGHSPDQASYALHIGTEAVDILAFRRLADRGRELEDEGNTGEVLNMCLAAQSLWRGQPLADLQPTPYVRAVRQGLLDVRQDLRTRAARARLELGAVSEAVVDLQQLHLEHPGDDGIVLLLTTALVRAGARRRALELLDEELRTWQRQYAHRPEQLLRQREWILSDEPEESR
ncbi:BTAD domain-containing putative transcriptional regulator [Kitasatospora sp. NPDC090091]|uniref:AfsR/SARP family transcriptional regulator n=1 Tax=Kitasatospora sp. NPDC090091 TaxID=3364081 RepID=UPI00381B2DAC